MPQPTPAREFDREPDMIGQALAVAVVAAAVAAVVVPALLCLAAFLLVRRWLNRWHFAALAAAGLIAFLLAPSDNTRAYTHWLLVCTHVWHGDAADIPIVPITALAYALLGATGLVLGGSHDAAQPRRIGERLWRRTPLIEPSLIPSKRRRDAARAKLARTQPLDKIPAVRGPRASSRSAAQTHGKRRFALGIGGDRKPVWLSEAALGMHGVILGGTGSGKTETIKYLAGALLDMGWDGIVIDLKEDLDDGGLRDFCRAYSSRVGLDYQEIALSQRDGQFWFNTFAGMTADEANDTVLSLFEFDDQYWRALNKKMLAQLMRMCYLAHEAAPEVFPFPSMQQIGRILETGAAMKTEVKSMAMLLDDMNGAGFSKAAFNMILAPSQDAAKSAVGFGNKLTTMYDSDAGQNVLSPGSGRVPIDVTSPGLVYAGMNSNGQPEMAKLVSSAMLQRLSVLVGQAVTNRGRKGARKFVIVDEANFIDRGIVMNLLSRGRSAGIHLILCTQGPNDWIDRHGDDWSRLTQNTNVAIIMAQGTPGAAELCADFIGTRKTTQLTKKIVNDEVIDAGTMSTRDEHIVTAQELRELEIGEAILRIGKPETSVRFLKVPQRLEELAWYSQGGEQ